MYIGPLRAGDMRGGLRDLWQGRPAGSAAVAGLCAAGAGASLGARLANSWETASALVAWSAGALILLVRAERREADGRRGKKPARP